MKQFILLFIGMFIAISLFSQEKKMNQKLFDTESNNEIMIGYCSFAGITDTTFNSAYKSEYKAFSPDKEISDQLFSLLDGVTITIVMGTWCSDSREQVPRFMRLLDISGYAVPDPILICVDRNKKAGDVSLEGMDILKVPTFLVYHYGMELGRIIETPKTTLEKDLLTVLKKKL